MDHPSALEPSNGSQGSITEELIAATIAGLVSSAYARGQSLEDLTDLVLEEDPELDQMTRQWLSEIVAEAWKDLSGSECLEAA
ncbi:hypothetical protein [Altericista sp. CCNU0014]|uniref:hypothetical protein n=1 Tax=Altericista sp. CCNU0014 TaxID=3082949 RepID=UPI00384B1273